ncbi:hypothetical protein [Sessilibacter sp. MAH4]
MKDGCLKNEQRSKWEYKEGDLSLDDSKISKILGREDDFIVFISDDNCIVWEHREIPEWAYVGIDEYEKINSKIPTFLGQIHKEEIKALMAACLLSVFRSKKHDEIDIKNCFDSAWSFIKEIDKRKIIHAGTDYYLYENNERLLSICSKQKNINLDKAYLEALYLSQQAKYSLKFEQLSCANDLISRDLARFDASESDISFNKSRSYIEKQIQESARVRYLIISMASALVICIITILAYYNISNISEMVRQMLLCSIAGITGAVVSILQRNEEIRPEPFSSNLLFVFQGITRILLGVIFGSMVAICAKANIALGLASDNIYAIFVIAFLAGINERFIPDLIRKNIN